MPSPQAGIPLPLLHDEGQLVHLAVILFTRRGARQGIRFFGVSI